MVNHGMNLLSKTFYHREHTDYTEGNAWQHSWFVLHDVKNFIELHGGPAPFTNRLEQLFTESSEITGDNISAGYYRAHWAIRSW